ncbi:hypothetical protein QAD02_000746 [Eretmocerus hayati]|uniref:Uncharacterized protein n=1 Tax=Eretmocerus hayati TaxID=131215 RepID=A0ACC2NEF7_9HYME|nr:hypothetical protein QAD02_000746 [Eretmocerus hayati]
MYKTIMANQLFEVAGDYNSPKLKKLQALGADLNLVDNRNRPVLQMSISGKKTVKASFRWLLKFTHLYSILETLAFVVRRQQTEHQIAILKHLAIEYEGELVRAIENILPAISNECSVMYHTFSLELASMSQYLINGAFLKTLVKVEVDNSLGKDQFLCDFINKIDLEVLYPNLWSELVSNVKDCHTRQTKVLGAMPALCILFGLENVKDGCVLGSICIYLSDDDLDALRAL